MSSMESSLPKGWRRLKIRAVARIQTGFAFKSDWYVNGGVRLLRNANVSQRCVDWTDQVCLPEERYDEFDAFTMQENDIVLSLDRPLVAAGLKVAMVTPADLPALLVQRVARFQLSNEIDASFLYAFLQSPLFINQISGHDQSLGVPHISPGQVGNVDIPLPTLEEQKQIAKKLRSQSTEIELAKKAAENQLASLKSLFACEVKTLIAKERDKGTNDSKLGDICKLINGKASKPSDWSENGVPIIRIQNLNDVTKPFNYWSGNLERQVIVKQGDVLLAWSGTPGTSFGAHKWNRENAVLNQHIFRVDLDSSVAIAEWIVPAINFQLEVLIQNSHGGVGLRHVKRGEVERLQIPLSST